MGIKVGNLTYHIIPKQGQYARNTIKKKNHQLFYNS